MANKLKLGDIIQISAPADTDIDEHIYYIRYIDENKIRLEEAGKETILTLTDGYYDNESIENIIIKSRAEEVGRSHVSRPGRCSKAASSPGAKRSPTTTSHCARDSRNSASLFFAWRCSCGCCSTSTSVR